MYFRCVAADQWSRKHNSPSFRKSDGGWVQPCVRGTCLLSNQCSRSWSSWGHSCRPWRLLVYGWYYQMIDPVTEALWTEIYPPQTTCSIGCSHLLNSSSSNYTPDGLLIKGAGSNLPIYECNSEVETQIFRFQVTLGAGLLYCMWDWATRDFI